MEKDFFLNLLVVVLLIVGSQSLLAEALAPDPTGPPMPDRAIKIYVKENGDVHFESLFAPPEALSDVVTKVMDAVDSRFIGRSVPVVIHHTEKTPAGVVHAVLRAIGRVSHTQSFLALCRYHQSP